MQEEQDTCRICSAPAEPDQPLFYPCKCSGTIRYIHQDCLTTWLAHSRKKTCDVCKHPYTFAKVYDPNMPESLPPLLIVRRVTQQVFFMLVFIVRAVCVSLIWLALLPWITMWTWRMYFLMGDSTAWWIANRPRPPLLHSLLTPANGTSLRNSTIHASPANATFFARVTSHPAWTAVSADIFGGQIIASSIIISFVAVFLLREWISQNARPGLFDDVEPPGLVVEDPPVLEMPEPEVEPEANFQQPNQVPTPPLVPEDIMEPDETLAPRQGGDVSPSVKKPRTDPRDKRLVGEGRALRLDPDTLRGRRRVPRNSKRDQSRSEASTGLSPKVPASALPSTYDFTFGATPTEDGYRFSSHQRRSSSEPPTIGSSPPFVSEAPPTQRPWLTSTPDAGPSHPSQPDATPSGSDTQLRQVPQRLPNFPRRPPLPVSAVSSPLGTPVLGYPPGTSPLASPSLATYQAPEELESSTARLPPLATIDHRIFMGKGKERAEDPETAGENGHGYFGDDAETIVRERDRYFKLVDDSTLNEAGNAVADDTAPQSDTEDGDSVNEEVVIAPPPPVQVHVERLEAPFPFEEDDDDPDDEEAPELEGVEGAPFAEPWEGGEPEVERARLVEEVDRMEAELRELQRERAELEQLEAMAEEDGDLDGIFEVIGLRGRMSTVLQNATLVIFALDTAIGLGVWLPFMVGKSTALLSLDPPRLAYVIQSPIRAIRIMTDPIVDVVEIFLIFPTTRLIRTLSHSVLDVAAVTALTLISKLFGAGADIKVQEFVKLSYNRVQEGLKVTWAKAAPVEDNPTAYEPFTTAIDHIFQSDSNIVQWAEPHFAELGKRARITAMHMQAKWTQLALGSGPQEKVFAIALGYAVFAFLLALYLNVLTMGTMRSAGRAVRSTVRQQLLVAKVGIFVLIEVVAFPLGCGIVLDWSTIWLCPGASVQSRKDFTLFAPTTSAFYHWLVGTIFMYQFAMVLNGCRRVMRPGALWFIKDPQDQNFHPIRDIIERSSWTQMRKLLLSAEMYVAVICAGAGAIGAFLWLSPLLPFRWKTREPLSDVPIDLVLLLLLMPYTMRFLRPSKPMRRWTRRIWRRLSAQLRLSSYMFGKRYPLEEFSPHRWSFLNTFTVLQGMEVQDSEGLRDGGFRRVPATDSVALGKNMVGTARVDEFGNPVDERNSRLMQAQDHEAIRANRDVLKDYTVVYVPPLFHARICMFILALWVIGSAFAATVITIPILLGRGVFNALLSRDVHDGYSFLVGFYLLWGAWTVGKALDRMDKRRQRERDWHGPKAEWPVWVAKRVFRWLANISYMMFALGFVLPILVAIVVELYVVLPLRLTLNPALQVRFRIVDMWMLGILYMKIVLRTRRMRARSPFMRGVDRIVRNGWTHPDPLRATEEVIGPAIGGMLVMILLPAGLLALARRFSFVLVNDKFLLMHVYPSVFATVGLATSFVAFASSWELWAQSLREKEFLVEMRLQNLEPGTPSTDETPAENNQVAPAVPLAAEVGDEAADSDDDDDDAD